MERMLQDFRFAVRVMVRRRGTAVLAVLTFGLGIAASTAMFSVVDAVLLRPLPFAEPESIVSVYARNPQFRGHPTLGFAAERGSFSTPEIRALRESTEVLDGLAVLSTGGAIVETGGVPERIPLGRTTVDLFSRILRVAPLVGRVFIEDDGRTQARVIVLTEGYWRSRYGGDPAVVGQALVLGDTPVEIVGVLAQEATLPGYEVSGWVLVSEDDNWGNHWIEAIGRLAPGVSAQQASERMSAVLAQALPANHDVHGVNLFPRQADETRNVRGPLVLLTAAALLLLFVACGNVALLVGAAIDREQELAVRAALGADRGRLVRQLLTESVLLALGAAGVGVALAGLVTRGLVALAPDGVPRIADATVNLKVLGFGVLLSTVCGIVFGLIPALGFSRTDLRRTMNVATRGATARSRVQSVVVVAELALATVLLVGAGLLARTLLAINSVDPGFAAHETLSLRLAIPFQRITGTIDNDSARTLAQDAFYVTLLTEIGSVPGVRGVAMTSNTPLTPDRGNNDVEAEGNTAELIAERRFVSANFFDVMGIRMVEGRAFEPTDDRADAPLTVILSEGLARLAWPAESAIGKRFGFWGRTASVVGVAENIRDEELERGTELAFYAPRRAGGWLGGSLVVRTDGRPAAVVPAIRQRIAAVNPGIAVIGAQPFSELLADHTSARRYRARLITVFSLLAALFALMGIYGVTNRNVAARTRELGIRLALGAARRRVTALVIVQALQLGLAGAFAGIIAALIATRSIEAYLWGVAPTDPLTLVGIALALAAAAVLAALAPGLRAARVDPMEALRTE